MPSDSTATNRIFSASLANWIGIAVTLLTQIAFVPIYLSHWSADVYGVWLLLYAFMGLAGLIQSSHRDFIYYESLKLGKQNLEKVTLQLTSALPIVVLISFLVFSAIYLQFEYKIIDTEFGLTNELLADFLYSALILAFVLLIAGNYYGFLLGPIILLGYYPYITWLKVVMAFITATTPVITISLGGGLIEAVFTLAATIFLVNTIAIFLVLNIYKKEGIKLSKPKSRLGVNQFFKSSWLLAKNFSDTFRQLGIRFLIIPFVGPGAVTQFATNRTVANVALQGLNSLTGPIMPELMRFVNERKQQEINTTLALVWLMLCFVMAPGFVLLQLYIEPLFQVWTVGAIEFHPPLFAVLSSSILMITLAQPAESILRGNNLYKTQLVISLIALTFLVMTVFIFANSIGLLSAGLGLLVAEFVGMGLAIWKAQEWLKGNQLLWPWQGFNLSLISVVLTTASLLLIAYQLLPKISAVIIICLQLFIAYLFWSQMPQIAKEKASLLFSKFRFQK
jgi:O-antigen/teichoic acid export membrane protein